MIFDSVSLPIFTPTLREEIIEETIANKEVAMVAKSGAEMVTSLLEQQSSRAFGQNHHCRSIQSIQNKVNDILPILNNLTLEGNLKMRGLEVTHDPISGLNAIVQRCCKNQQDSSQQQETITQDLARRRREGISTFTALSLPKSILDGERFKPASWIDDDAILRQPNKNEKSTQKQPSGVSSSILDRWKSSLLPSEEKKESPSTRTNSAVRSGKDSILFTMKLIQGAGEPIIKAEQAIGKGVEKLCNTSIMQPVCKVTGQALGMVAETVESLIPEVVKEGTSNVLNYLEAEGIPKTEVMHTAHSVISLVTVAIPINHALKVPKVGRGLSKEIASKVRDATDHSIVSMTPVTIPANHTVTSIIPSIDPINMQIARATLSALDKKKAAYKSYLAGLESEKSLLIQLENQSDLRKFSIQQLRTHSILRNLPSRFPLHLNDFLRKFETHSFKGTKLGINKGSFEGSLIYRPIENDVLFLIQYNLPYGSVERKLGSRLLSPTNLYWDERIDYLLQMANELANEKGFQRRFFIWNPKKLPAATILQKRSESILGIGKFSAGVHKDPLTLVEIAPKK